MHDGFDMLHNILDGNLANGEPGVDWEPPALRDGHLRLLGSAACDLSARMLEPLERDQPPVLLTAFLRMVVMFLVSGGANCANPSLLTRVAKASAYARSHPQRLMDGTGFAELVALGLRNDPPAVQEEDRNSIDNEIQAMRAKCNPPPPAVPWTCDGGHYALHEATHPFHVWELGVRLGNCLCRAMPNSPGSRIHGTDDPALLRLIPYWSWIEKGSYDLLSLHSGTTIIAVFGVAGGWLTELTLRHPDEPYIGEIVADTTLYLDSRYRTFRVDLTRRSPFANAFIDKVQIARKRRGLQPIPVGQTPDTCQPFGRIRRLPEGQA